MSKKARKVISSNKKAFHEYFVIETYSAGVVLSGTEIKSIRKGAVNLKDSFAKITAGELWLHNCHISVYEQGNRYNHDPDRERKLLLNKSEILKMLGKVKKENYAIVPLEMYLQNGWAKVDIALAKGKKLHDKRDDIAAKSAQRDMQRAMKR